MEDDEIVALYWARSEQAVKETARKYGKYCYAIAYRILASEEDAAECVNDTWLHAWNSIPPHRPVIFSAFLGKLTRRAALHRWRYYHAEKRGGGEMALVLEELENCIPAHGSVQETLESKELTAHLNSFLRTLPKTERRVFVCRYWYLDPIADICMQFGFSQSKVKSMLYRTRIKLLSYLQKEGFIDEK